MASRIQGITVEIGGDTTKLSKALESVNKSIKGTQSGLKDVNKLLKLDPSNTELVVQKQKMLKDAIEATKEKLATLKTAAQQANEQLANGEITQQQYDALQREIVETEQNLRSLQDQAATTNATLAKIDEAGEKLQNIGSSVENVGKKFLPVTAAVTGLGTAAVKTAADFDSEMSKVSAISGATGDDFDQLRAKAREMGAKTKFSASEAASAMEYMAMAGWKTSDMLNGIEGIMNLAAASGEDLATTSDIVTDALTAFGLSATDEGTRETIIKIGLLAASIGPLLIVLGKTISTVGTAMRGFSSLAKGVRLLITHVGSASGVFSKLGVVLGGLSGPVVAVVAVVGTLVAAFMNLWNTNEEFRTAITGIWNDIVSKVKGFCNQLTQRINGLGFDFKDVTEVLKAVWDGFCQVLAPLFEGALQIVATVLSTVLDTLLGLFDVFSNVFSGNWSGAWEAVKGIFSSIWDGVKSVFSTTLTALKSALDVFLGLFGTDWQTVWGSIKSFFETVWSGISSFFSNTVSAIQSVATTVFTAVSGFFTTILTSIQTTFSTIWTAISTAVSSVLNTHSEECLE